MTKTITLTNGRGEQITMTIKVEGRTTAQVGTPERHQITLTIIEASAAVEIEGGVRAVYADGSPLQHWRGGGSSITMSRGDVKRMGTYPLFLYANGDRSRRGRFQLRSIDGVDRFNYRAAAVQ